VEERRITFMYLEIVKRRLIAAWEFISGGGLMRSGLVTGTFLALIVGIVFFLIHERGRRHYANLKEHIKQKIDGGVAPVAPSGPKPGGMEPLTLTRFESAERTSPEFASVTMLPGLGMSVLQVTAYVPGRGEIPLLVAPTLDSLSPPANANSAKAPVAVDLSQLHGQLEVPWAGTLRSTTENWQGQEFAVPGVAGGLLGGRAVSHVATDILIDGGSATGTFDASDFEGHWPGTTRVKVTVLLIGSRLELTVLATNAGTSPEPMGIGWMPHFALRDDRQRVVLKLPPGDVVETAGPGGIPTGRFLPAKAAVSRFISPGGEQLNDVPINETLAHMKPGLLEEGAVAELRFPEAGYGLRLSAMSSSIKALRVDARAGNPYVSLGMETNFPDPLGPEWPTGNASGMAMLMPGQSLEWRMKMDIFLLADHP
jgi:galactose mutarotase-like enzyme